MGGYRRNSSILANQSPQSSIPLLRTHRSDGVISLPSVARSRHPTCRFSRIIRALSNARPDTPGGSLPACRTSTGSLVRNEPEATAGETDCLRDAAGYTLGGGVRVPGGPRGLQNRCGGASSPGGFDSRPPPLTARPSLRTIHRVPFGARRCLARYQRLAPRAPPRACTTFAERAETHGATSSWTSSTHPLGSSRAERAGSRAWSCRCR